MVSCDGLKEELDECYSTLQTSSTYGIGSTGTQVLNKNQNTMASGLRRSATIAESRR